jgi:hypothetical protein
MSRLRSAVPRLAARCGGVLPPRAGGAASGSCQRRERAAAAGGGGRRQRRGKMPFKLPIRSSFPLLSVGIGAHGLLRQRTLTAPPYRRTYRLHHWCVPRCTVLRLAPGLTASAAGENGRRQGRRSGGRSEKGRLDFLYVPCSPPAPPPRRPSPPLDDRVPHAVTPCWAPRRRTILPTCVDYPSHLHTLLDRPGAGCVPPLSPARCLPTRGSRSTSRAAGNALGGERRPGLHRQMVPTGRYGGWGVRPHDLFGPNPTNGQCAQ